MKITIMSAAAVAVAGLAVAAYARNRSAANTSRTVAAGNDFFGMLSAQRQASGAAQSQNTDYMASWPSMQQYGATQPDF